MKHYHSSLRVQHLEKKWIVEAQPILGTRAQVLTPQASISSLQVIPTIWIQCENPSAQGLGRNEKRNGNWHQRISCHGKNENALWGQHKAQQEWNQHPPGTLAGQCNRTLLSRNCPDPNLTLLPFSAY